MNSSQDDRQECLLGYGHNRCELDENLEILRHTPAFSGVPLERLRLCAYLSRRVCYRPGDFLFRQGEADKWGYIVISGKAQVIREYKDHSIILNEFKEGEFFGGLALLSEIKRPFSIRAIEPLTCLALDRDSFQKVLSPYPEVTIRIMADMLRRVMDMVNKLLDERSPECICGINL